MTTFFLIRHGLNDSIGNWIAGRMAGVHLNSEGRVQAEKLADHLARLPIVAVYTSPMERARETAEPIARKLGLEVQVCIGINEIDCGIWTGKRFDELKDQVRWKRYNRLRSGSRIPNGELMLEAQTRAVQALEELCGRHPDQSVALISHGDVIRAVIAYFAGIPLDLFTRIEVSCASVSVIELDGQDPRIWSVNQSFP